METQQQESQPIQNQPAENHQPNQPKPDKRIIIGGIIVIVLALAAIGAGAYYWWQSLGGSSQQACTMEAKLCPDGSSVGRTGPNCEFAECPEDVSVGWQTYKNEQYGFEFKYPKEWELKENNQIISFTAPANLIGKGNQLASIKPEIVINRDKGSYRNLEDFLSKWEYNDSDLSALWNISNIAYKEINGSRFFYYEYYHQVKGFVFLTIKDGDLVQIKFIDETGQNGNFLSAYGDFVKLISTFKFIEPIDTSNWQTYRNEECGFEFKYPADWKLEVEGSRFSYDNKMLLSVSVNNENKSFLVIIEENQPWQIGQGQEQKVQINNSEESAYIFPKGWECYENVCPEDPSFFTIPIKRDKLWYSLEAHGEAETITGVHKDIISTFKFLNNNIKSCADVYEWSTYTDAPHDFQISYPKGWTRLNSTQGVIFYPSNVSENEKEKMSLVILPNFSGKEGYFKVLPKCQFGEENFHGTQAFVCTTEGESYCKEIRLTNWNFLYEWNWNQNNSIGYCVLNKYKDLVPEYDNILTTFKFIGSNIADCAQEQVQMSAIQPMQSPTATSSVFLVTKAGGKIFSPGNKMNLEIPEGALASDAIIRITILNASSLGALELYDISPVDVDILEFLKPATLNISYDKDELPKNVSEKDFMVGELGDFESWNIIDSCIDTVNHVIRGKIDKIEKSQI